MTQLHPYLTLRLAVGYLGEKANHGWWPTEFYEAHSLQFLNPAFPRTARLAQYNGVRQAARRVHDEHVGIGRVFHLFRLPEEVEQDLHRNAVGIDADPSLVAFLSSADAAMKELLAIAGTAKAEGEGPIAIGTTGDFRSSKSVSALAAYYVHAFDSGKRVYPYFTA